MKTLVLASAILSATALMADAVPETHDDLAPCASESTSFWNTTAHPQPVCYRTSASVGATVATTSASGANGSLAFDTRLKTFMTAVLDGLNSFATSIRMSFR